MIAIRHQHPNSSKILLRLLVLILLGLGVGCDESSIAPVTTTGALEFVGSDSCQKCHQTQYSDWQGSHHQLAMQVANENTVLGDFSDAVFDYFGTQTEFIEREGAFIIRTENGHGEQQEFKVTHTFGVTPLQQYLVDFPDGRKQVPSYAWDTRSAESGGQRWYHLYPDEFVRPDDPLHWTSRYFNWNLMCAECHSTNVALNYELETNKFDTTFSEVSVGCEACHGPGSRHIDQAQRAVFDKRYGLPVDLDDRDEASWIMNFDTGIAERSTPGIRQQQPESCGRCHARRSVLTADYEYGKPLTDTHMPSLLAENLYHADGRILEEVYVYGSFVQSKMYAAGVTCSDCHDSHSAKLVTGPEPNAVCSQCHLPAKFATPNHGGSNPTACVDCHMPETTYMGVDGRRDHSFRLPDTDKDPQHYGAAIAAGRSRATNQQLLEVLDTPGHPAIARATILTLFSDRPDEAEFNAIVANLKDSDPMVRIASLRALRRFPPELRLRAGSHLLRDPVRGVRVEAAIRYVDVRDQLSIEDASAFVNAADEFRHSQLAAASMPESLTMLSEFETQLGNVIEAQRYLEHALKLDPKLAVTQHAYGLLLVRNGKAEVALEHLRRAAELDPANGRFAYVLGVALNSSSKSDEALTVLTEAKKNFPGDFDIAWGLATMLRDAGDIESALSVTRDMKQRFPGHSNVDALLRLLNDSPGTLDRTDK